MPTLETDSGDQSTSLGTVIIEEENYTSSVKDQDSGLYYWREPINNFKV